MKMQLRKYRVKVYHNGSESVNYADTATGFDKEEAIRKVAKIFTGRECITNPSRLDCRDYPLTFIAEELIETDGKSNGE